jgi:hypothetical protein
MSNRFVPPRSTGYVVDQAAVTAAAYEFDSNDNQVFSGLSGAMKFVAVVSAVLGVLEIVGGMLTASKTGWTGLLQVGQGFVMVLIGGWLGSAAGALKEIVTTEGNDIGNLMLAMRKLKSVYTLQAWLLGLACAFVLVAVLYFVQHS